MSLFGSVSAPRRLTRAALFTALVGLAPALVPAPAAAAPPTCGRVHLVNTQNELLRLRRTADDYQELAERAKQGPRVDIRFRTSISGLADGEVLVGIDFRPATGVLYGVGRIGNSGDGQLYTIDVDSGLATPVVDVRTIPLSGVTFGVDFNPVPDLLRIVSDAGQNQRVRPADARGRWDRHHAGVPGAGRPECDPDAAGGGGRLHEPRP